MKTEAKKIFTKWGRRPFTRIVVVLVFTLFFLAISFLPWFGLMEALSDFTKQDLIDAILERKTFTEEQLDEMDLNNDGKVDVADLVNYSRPVADFDRLTSQVTEGSVQIIVKVNFTSPMTGVLEYTVSGTAVPGDDYESLSGTVDVNGDTVDIPINIIDDAEIEDTESIIITIHYEDETGLKYLPGAFTQHTVYIVDNDAIWAGTMQSNDTAVHIAMKIVQTLSGPTISLYTDGHGVIPLNDGSNEWPATETGLSNSFFHALIEAIPVNESSTLTGVAFQKNLEFNADENIEGQSVNPSESIVGVVTETLLCPSSPQFNRVTQGKFSLRKEAPGVTPEEINLEPVNGEG